ncbi:MAG TPA: methyltransferase [Candidatus Cloacimonadota bacterium]|nr:methyltransferase [Candidatus Cloacimonadota bacterium]
MTLPFGEGIFWQAVDAQAVSSAANCLQSTAVELFKDEPLRVLDLGCGSGIVAVMLALQRPHWKITGIDIQAPLIDLALENAQLNSLKIDFLCADLKSYHDPVGFDLIVSNPPWLCKDSGHTSPRLSKEHSRREILCDMHDVIACLNRNLKSGKDALLLYPPQRFEQLQTECSQYLLDIKATLFCAETQKHNIYHIKSQRMTP